MPAIEAGEQFDGYSFVFGCANEEVAAASVADDVFVSIVWIPKSCGFRYYFFWHMFGEEVR